MAPKDGWILDVKALRRWVFSNWGYLENIMRDRLILADDALLTVVQLDGSFKLETRRFSKPYLMLYPAGSTSEYAVFSVSEHPELSFLVASRVVNAYFPQPFVFTRYELAHPVD
jgi:hypothetical protein